MQRPGGLKFLNKLETKDFKDLIRIVGVYLDNAIEASAESNDKKLGIEIYLAKEDIDIIISNTFNNNIKIDNTSFFITSSPSLFI